MGIYTRYISYLLHISKNSRIKIAEKFSKDNQNTQIRGYSVYNYIYIHMMYLSMCYN